MLAESCRIVYDYSRAERNSTGSTSNPCTNSSLTSLCMGKEIQTDADWKTEKDRLNSEIIKLEASLIEAKEVTSVNLTEEISDEFTNKLREAKRERVRVEDEFEDATAQWRSERRRLNSEIDGLEQSVQKLRSDARHARASGGSGSEELRAEAEEATRLKEQAEEARGLAKRQWATEKQELEEKISDLETQIVEALERSSNPTRASDAIESRLQAEMEARIETIRTESTEERAGAEKEWQTERGRLHLEISRLRKSGGTNPALPTADPKAAEVREELETRVRTATRALADLDQRSESDSAGWETEKQALEKNILDLKERLDKNASTWHDERDGLTAKISHLEGSLAEASSRVAPSELETLREEMIAKLDQAEAARSEFEQRLGTERADWENERASLATDISKLEVSVSEGSSKIDPAELDAIKDALLSRLADSEEKRTALEGELKAAADQREKERSEFEQQMDQLKQSTGTIGDAQETELREQLSLEYEWKIEELTFQKDQLEQKINSAGTTPSVPTDNADISGEIADIDTQIAALTKFIDDPTASLSTVIRKNVERAELEAYRRGICFQIDGTKKEKGAS